MRLVGYFDPDTQVNENPYIFSVVAILVIINGTLLYVIEGGPGTAFSSIPTFVYWAITIVSTVGFGDISPKTDLGRAIASVTMLIYRVRCRLA